MFGKNNIHYDFSYYSAIFRDYDKIKGHTLEDEKRIRKMYIDFYVAELNKNTFGSSLSTYELPKINEIIGNNEELQNYYDEKMNKISNGTNFTSWLQEWEYNIQSSFATNYIGLYNNFDIDDIVSEFKTNEKFYEAFFNFFVSVSNAVIDKDNNLFKAFINFLERDKCKIKSEKLMVYLKSRPDASLNKLFAE